MNELKITWDPAKARINLRKHGVSFEEASSIFLDENAIEATDEKHSESEDRFLMLGMSYNLRVLLICHCYRENWNVIRIISARRATKSESLKYWRMK